MTDGAWIQGMKELSVLPDKDLEPAELANRGEVYRKHLQCLTDRQWFHAVDQAVKHEGMFPTVSALLQYADQAPPPIVDWTGDCPLCEGTGFEPFERGGYAYVRFCPRGCKVASEKPRDYRTEDEKRADAKVGMEQIKAAVAEREAKDADAGKGGRQPRGHHGRPTRRGHSGEVFGPDGQGLP